MAAYNAERSLGASADSVLRQTGVDYELVLVDDGSTDQTLRRMKSLQRQAPRRVRVIQNEQNRGCVFARWRGVQEAKGEFVMFVDADDTLIESNTLQLALEAITKHQAQILHFQALLFTQNHAGSTHWWNPSSAATLQNPEFTVNLLRFSSGHTLWAKLFERKLLQNAYKLIGKEFIEKHTVYTEDFLLTTVAYSLAQRYRSEVFMGYAYMDLQGNSIQNARGSKEKARKHISDALAVVLKLLEVFQKTQYETEVRATVQNVMLGKVNEYVKLHKCDEADTVLFTEIVKHNLVNHNTAMAIQQCQKLHDEFVAAAQQNYAEAHYFEKEEPRQTQQEPIAPPKTQQKFESEVGEL